MTWLTLSLVLPWVALVVLVQPAGRRLLPVILPLAAAPAALGAWLAPDEGLTVPGLLLGAEFALDGDNRGFLAFTGLLWLAAGAFAPGYLAHDPRRRSYAVFHLLTLSGNLGLVLARDVPSFYTAFALMTFAAYGLVIHQRTAESRRAARIYLVMAVIGEALLLWALFLAIAAADSWQLKELRAAVAAAPERNLIMFLGCFGFGVKAGLLPMHFWLPLAHPVAPTPASAVLSGAMVKAGLIGWWYLLPFGAVDAPLWSGALIALGLLAAFFGVFVGLTQSNPKATLAYSTISQMGVMTAGLGAALHEAGAAPAALAAVGLYAFNHALAKGALFLGVGVSGALRGTSAGRRRGFVMVMSLPAFALAGAPLLAGATAKDALKYAVTGAAGPAGVWLGVVLSLSAAATSVLLGRFLWLIWRDSGRGERHPVGAVAVIAWILLVVASVAGGTLLMHRFAEEVSGVAPTWDAIWSGAWPILLGVVVLVGLAALAKRTRGLREWRVPAGDGVVAVESTLRWARPRTTRWMAATLGSWQVQRVLEHVARHRPLQRGLNRFERGLQSWEIAGAVILALLVAVWWGLG
jgi:hydrogenase-4 component B